MVGEGEPLHVAEQLRAEIPQQHFASVSGEQRAGKVAKLGQHRRRHQQHDHQHQQRGLRLGPRRGQTRIEETGQGMPAEHAVHDNLQRQRREQRQRRREQTQQEQAREMGPIGSHLQPKPPE